MALKKARQEAEMVRRLGELVCSSGDARRRLLRMTNRETNLTTKIHLLEVKG